VKQLLVDIVIVNWNSGNWLRNALASIDQFGKDIVGTTIVVDNGSTDDSAGAADDRLGVKLVRTGQNLGFGRACNLGATSATATYLLFLNPDAALVEGGLQAAVDFMESDAAQKVGACGVRMIGESGIVQRDCGRFPSARSFVGYSFGIAKLFPAMFPQVKMNDFDHLTDRRVDHVIGAFYMVLRSVFEEIGGFDERFFVYYEDLDLSRRIINAGWTIQYVSHAAAFHKGGGTSEQVKAHRLFYDLRSRILYSFKHFSTAKAWAVTLSAVLVEPIALVARAMLRRSPQQSFDTLRGFKMLWADMPNIIRTARARPPKIQGNKP
jgi:GT2 family glycosyltransferase